MRLSLHSRHTPASLTLRPHSGQQSMIAGSAARQSLQTRSPSKTSRPQISQVKLGERNRSAIFLNHALSMPLSPAMKGRAAKYFAARYHHRTSEIVVRILVVFVV